MEEDEKPIIFIPREENYIEILGHKIDGYSSFESFLEELKELKDVREKNKEQEAIITALKGANVVINQDLKEFKNSMAIISEICVDESKCHITSREAVEEIRKNIFWKAKGE